LFYLLVSVVAFAAMGLDKRAAARGRARIPELRLHALEVAGGFPGSLAAQQLFRHKCAKLSYQITFWAIVVLHAAGWAAWWWAQG
jgi:uncharacterized membrane protein YsdA (DUF1294 family)